MVGWPTSVPWVDGQQHAFPRCSAHRPGCIGGCPQSFLASTPVGTSTPRCVQRPNVPCCHGVPGARLGGDWRGGLAARSRQGCCHRPVGRAHHSASSAAGAVGRGLTAPVTEPLGRSGHAFRTGAIPESSCCSFATSRNDSVVSTLVEVSGFSAGVAGVEVGQAVGSCPPLFQRS